jgi:predicted TIM-barrel enzyme
LSADELRERMASKAETGKPVIFVGAGNGLSAKCAELGGADAAVIYNSGRFRMAGRGSLAGLMPYGNANEVVFAMAREIVPVVAEMPIIAGVCATDPFRDMDGLLDELEGLGVIGVQNFPTVGLIDGVFRLNLEATGMSYQAEVEMIRKAGARGMFTMPYVFDASQAREMEDAGADIVVAHLGLTAGGLIGAPEERVVEDISGILMEISRSIRKDTVLLSHGGPIVNPADVRRVMELVPGVAGFVGASSVERLASEEAIVKRVREFTGNAEPE